MLPKVEFLARLGQRGPFAAVVPGSMSLQLLISNLERRQTSDKVLAKLVYQHRTSAREVHSPQDASQRFATATLLAYAPAVQV